MDGSSPAAATPMGPSELLAHVARVRERLDLGILDADAPSAALGRVHLIDTGGHAWAAGIRSRDWYRFRARAMVAGRPAARSADLSPAWSCWLPVRRAEPRAAAACRECGAARPSSRLGPGRSRLADFLERGYDTLPERCRARRCPSGRPGRPRPCRRPAPPRQTNPARPACRTGLTVRRLRSVARWSSGQASRHVRKPLRGGVGGLLEPPVSSPAP